MISAMDAVVEDRVDDGSCLLVDDGSCLLVGEVAARLRVSVATVYRLIRSGDLAAVRVASKTRVRVSALVAFLDGAESPAMPEPRSSRVGGLRAVDSEAG